MKIYIFIIIYVLLHTNIQAQWVLEGPTPATFSLLNAAGTIVHLKHNDDTIIIKNGNGPFQIIKQKNGEMYSFIKNTPFD